MKDNIILMCFNEQSPNGNEKYSISGLTQIESILNHSYDCVDKIIVYNLGLFEETINLLKCYPKVIIEEIPQEYKDKYPYIMYPKHYAWKYLICDLGSKYGKNIFYIDSGTILITPLYNVFEYIKRHKILISTPWNCKTCDKDYTKKYIKLPCGKNFNNGSARICEEYIRRNFKNEEEKNYPYGMGAILGFKSDSRYHNNIVKKAKDMMLDKNNGHSEFHVHMHDQSIISLLSHREGVKMLDFDIIHDIDISNIGMKTQMRYVYNNGQILLAVCRQHGDLCKKLLNKFYDSYNDLTYTNSNYKKPDLNAYCYLNIKDIPENLNQEGDIFYSCLEEDYDKLDLLIKPKLRIIGKDISKENLLKFVNKYENLHSIKYDNIIFS